MVIRRRASTNNRSGGGAVLCWQTEASVSLSSSSSSSLVRERVKDARLLWALSLFPPSNLRGGSLRVETKHSNLDNFGSN